MKSFPRDGYSQGRLFSEAATLKDGYFCDKRSAGQNKFFNQGNCLQRRTLQLAPRLFP